MAEGLKFGRGMRRGQDAYVGQQESFAERADQMPKPLGWVLDAHRTGSLLDHVAPSVIGRLQLARVPVKSVGFLLTAVRIYISTAAANETLKAAIYFYDHAVRQFSLVAGTNVTFPLDAIGRIEVLLPRQQGVELQPWYQYFIGIIVSAGAGAARLSCMTHGVQPVELVREVASALEFSGTIALANTTKSVRNSVPSVTYMSKQAAEVT